MSENNLKIFLKNASYHLYVINNATTAVKKLELFIEKLKYMYINWKYIDYNLIEALVCKINEMINRFNLQSDIYEDSQKINFYEISNKCIVLFRKMGYYNRSI